MSTLAIAIIIVVFVCLIGLAFVMLFPTKKHTKDARSKIPPANYNDNLDTQEDEVIEGATPREAEEIVRKTRKGDLPALSRNDFYELKRKIEEK